MSNIRRGKREGLCQRRGEIRERKQFLESLNQDLGWVYKYMINMLIF